MVFALFLITDRKYFHLKIKFKQDFSSLSSSTSMTRAQRFIFTITHTNREIICFQMFTCLDWKVKNHGEKFIDFCMNQTKN